MTGVLAGLNENYQGCCFFSDVNFITDVAAFGASVMNGMKVSFPKKPCGGPLMNPTPLQHSSIAASDLTANFNRPKSLLIPLALMA